MNVDLTDQEHLALRMAVKWADCPNRPACLHLRCILGTLGTKVPPHPKEAK